MAAETSSQASKIGPPSPTQNSASGTQNFASGKLDSTPSAADGLSAFFQLKPVPYVEGENASKSKSTRPPKFFDLHLHEPLQLKTVVVSEELTQRFSSICDQKVRAFDAKVINAPGSASVIFPVLTAAEAISKKKVVVNSETCIVGDHSTRTAAFCTEVASKLLFGLEMPDVLTWEKTDRTAEQALPDGYVTLKEKPDAHLCQEQIAILNSLRTHLLHRLALFEFKSLRAGGLRKMTEIVNSAGEFSWMTCGSTDHLNRVHDCGVKRHKTKGIFSVTGRKTGYDATQEWWIKPHIPGKRRRDSIQDLDPEVDTSSTVTLVSDETETIASLSPSAHVRSTAANEGVELIPVPRHEGKQEVPHEVNEEQVVAGCALEQIQAPASLQIDILPRDHGDITGGPEGEINVPDRNQDPLKEDIPEGEPQTEPVHACDILQQVWAELVRFDATFGVISSGNYEIFVRRHRESQTLYISPVIHSFAEDNPAHYKLHTGLYVISYLDAENRAMQLNEMLQIPEEQWLPCYLRGYDRDSSKYVKPQRKRVKKDALKEVKCIDEQLLSELKIASRISLRFHAGDLADHEFHHFRRKNFPSVPGAAPQSTFGVTVAAEPPHDIGSLDVENNDTLMFDTDDENSTSGDQVVTFAADPPHDIDSSDVENNDILMFDTDDEDFSDVLMDCAQPSSAGILKLEIQKKLGGNHVYRGTISLAKGSTVVQYSGELVIKLAITRDRKTSLRNEFAAYSQLAQEKNSSSYIVEIYGLFTSRFRKYSKTAYEVLIMAAGGSSLDDCLRLPTSRERKERVRNAVQEAIKEFHEEYNFHNDLTSAHILFEEAKRSKNIQIRFISLSAFQHVEFKEEGDKEDTHKTSRLIKRLKGGDRGILYTIDSSWHLKASARSN